MRWAQQCRTFSFLLNLVRFVFRFDWEKICAIHYLHFSFEKHAPSQVFKDFSVKNLEITSLKIFFWDLLSSIINDWGIIFTLYLTAGAFRSVFPVSLFFLSCFPLFFFFYWYFFRQTLTVHRIAGMVEGVIVLFSTSTCSRTFI